MKKKKAITEGLYELRRRAEESLPQIQNKVSVSASPDEMHRVIIELSIHQIELEMQQEELLQSRTDLEESLKRYAELYDFAPLGYMTLARNGTILEANLTAARMLNVNRYLLKGARFGRFIAFQNLPVFNELLEQVYSRKGHKVAELILSSPNGTDEALMTVRIDAELSEDDQECRAIITDITKEKEAEKEKAILQENLMQAQKNESIGRMAGGIAHDFNNMLQVMLGNIDLLIDTEELKNSVREIFSELRISVLKSAGLVSQLLAFARRQPIELQVLDFNAAVSNTLSMLKRLLGENIELNCTLAKDLWLVKMDVSQIDQIITNLAINAKDAMQGIGKLSFETRNVVVDKAFCRRHPDIVPGDYVELVVQDNGSGMDKATLDSIFEPFFSTKSTISNKGLGLATVYGIVKQNKGVITVTSEIGKGTIFKIYLPSYTGGPASSSSLKINEKISGGNEIILLVEDDKSVRDITLGFLNSFGYTVLVASSPTEAISLSNGYAGTIQLLITDVIMPGMNGRNLALLLTKRRPDLKILLVSGYAANYLTLDENPNVSMPFLGKPFSRRELALKVRELLDRK
ncbi:MAG: ATP-binding protein [Chlorobiaceae bacterium]